MKLFKKIRKGFTLIELVVVIAVIAILAAVSVVSYVAITNKAKQSNDQQKIDQVNLSLAALEVSGKPETMYKAVKAVEEDGFKPENFKAEAKDYTFAYKMSENRFVILQKGSIVYPKNVETPSAKADLWQFSDKGGELTDGYSYYLRGTGVTDPVTVAGGLDVGDNASVPTVSYSSTASQDVVIRTIGGTLNVGSSSEVAKGTIRHYNYVDKAVVYTEKNSFHTRGAVGQLNLKEGKAVAEKGGVIYLVEAPSTTEVKQEGGVVIIPAGTSTSSVSKEVAQSIGYSDPGSAETYDNVPVVTEKTYNIANLEELKTFRDIVNGGFNFKGLTAKLTNNITLDKGWKPIGEGSRDVNLGNYVGSYLPEQDGKGASFAGIFDGNHKTISNLDSTGYVPTMFSVDGTDPDKDKVLDDSWEVFVYGFFGVVNNATIKDVTFKDVNIDFSQDISMPTATTHQKVAKADSVGAVAGYSAGSLTISGVTVNGSIKALDAVGGVVGRAYGIAGEGGHVSISNCVNNATVTATGAKAAGILGFANKNNISVSLSENANKGKVSAQKYAAGIAIVQELSSYTLDKNQNTADISVAEYTDTSATVAGSTVGIAHISTSIGIDAAIAATNNSSTGKTYLAGSLIETILVGKSHNKNTSGTERNINS